MKKEIKTCDIDILPQPPTPAEQTSEWGGADLNGRCLVCLKNPIMKIAAHPVQQAILEIVLKEDIGFNELSLRDIAKKVGEKSPQKIKHHLTQMVKYGYLDIIGGRYKVGKIMKRKI